MQSRTIFSWAVLSVACTACGCGSTGLITRGQDAHAPAPGQFQTYRSPVGAVQDHLHGQQTSYYTDGNGAMDHLHQMGASGSYGGNCPQDGYGGSCPNDGGMGCQPRHHRTYSYSAPRDLTYPAQSGPGAVGGAVVYPYYTHKGPSDFFRKK